MACTRAGVTVKPIRPDIDPGGSDLLADSMVAEKCNADVGPRSTSLRHRADVAPISLRRRSDVAPTSLRLRADVAPTSLRRRRSVVAPTSGRRRSDFALTLLQIAPLSLDRTLYMYNVYACVTCCCIADDDVPVSQSHNYP